MTTPLCLLVLCFLVSPSFSSSEFLKKLSKGSSLSVEDTNHVLISPNSKFSAGFYAVGKNAYCFAIWYSHPSCPSSPANCTVIWMANRDAPVNGKRSKLFLLNSGDLVLKDAGQLIAWEIKNAPVFSPLQLDLKDSGDLVLHDTVGRVYWHSFDYPTNTLLPQQMFTGGEQLVSSRSKTNLSSGFYKFYFDNDNVLRLLYEGPEIQSVYSPDPGSVPWEVQRTTYNSSKLAVLDFLGNFSSSDNFTFSAADYGVNLQRRLTLDFDGNLRLYSREEGSESWAVSWQLFSQSCTVHGICGPNSVCTYSHSFGRTCSCIPGFQMVNLTDWSFGCQPEFNQSLAPSEYTFLLLPHVEFYGYDFGFFPNTTLGRCKDICLQRADCKGFNFKFIKHDHPNDIPYCFTKTLLLNGQRSPNFLGDLYLKVPKTSQFSSDWPVNQYKFDHFPVKEVVLERKYKKKHVAWSLNFLLWFVAGAGIVEILCVLFVWLFLIRSQQSRGTTTQIFLAAANFKRFTYNELKKATRNFKEEIGRGAGGIVYKGKFSDGRVAAIKRLNDANQGEAEFLAEVNTIGKLNHMNLIEMWGYCVEGNKRLLVYEFMEHGSLAEKLSSKALDWKKRFEIAVGTAKGLAYLHEECLEWILHCDVKPQNILLNSDYQPKVSDFGLSRLLSRGDHSENSSFSRIRGTRGYMAPEWVFKLPITSKVDVYSYGIVVLELLTGKNPIMEAYAVDGKDEVEHRMLVAWIRHKKNGGAVMGSWLKEIIDPNMGSDFDKNKVETLVEVALQCVEEDKDARPTMSQVVEMLLHHDEMSNNIAAEVAD